MCLNKVHWWQYSHLILLLLVILASNSYQQRVISTPQPFRQSRTFNDLGSTVQPINNNDDAKESESVTNVQRTFDTKSVNTVSESISPTIDTSVVKNQQNEVKNIDANIRKFKNLMFDLIEMVNSFSERAIQKRSADGRTITDYLLDGKFIERMQQFATKYLYPVAKSAAQSIALENLVPTGARLFLFKGKLLLFNFQ